MNIWHYDFVIPSVLILAVFEFYYLARPRLPLRTSKTFHSIVIVDFFVVFFDVFSCEADMHFAEYPIWMLYFLNLAFFILFLLRGYLFFKFTFHVLQIEKLSHPMLTRFIDFVFALSVLTVLASLFSKQSVFWVDEAGYHPGPMYNVIYLCFFFYIFCSVAYVLQFRSCLRRRLSLTSVLLYNIILLIGGFFRILFPQYLMMNLFCLFAIIVIFVAFHNPELYLSDQGLAFNQLAFQTHIAELLGDKKYYILGITAKNYIDMLSLYGETQMEKGFDLITDYLIERFPGYIVYYLRNGSFALAGSRPMAYEQMKAELLERFRHPWVARETELALNVCLVYLDYDSGITSRDGVMNYFFHALHTAGGANSLSELIINEDYIREVDRSMQVKLSLEDAIKNNAVEAYLQPVIESRTGKPRFAEALARISDRSGNPISPEEFIPIAERNGEVSAVCMQVLEKVCAFISQYHPEENGIEWININVSPLQCMDPGLSSKMLRTLERYGIETERIHLELTEEAMTDSEEIQRHVNSLVENGFVLCLDDYGKGYSNLNRIKQFSFSNIKLDMAIVWAYFREKDILLPSMVSTFQNMGFSVTAEGIESEDMADALKKAGCNYLQGYYYSRPVPLRVFAEQFLQAG